MIFDFSTLTCSHAAAHCAGELLVLVSLHGGIDIMKQSKKKRWTTSNGCYQRVQRQVAYKNCSANATLSLQIILLYEIWSFQLWTDL
jgi:hypothetical protein